MLYALTRRRGQADCHAGIMPSMPQAGRRARSRAPCRHDSHRRSGVARKRGRRPPKARRGRLARPGATAPRGRRCGTAPARSPPGPQKHGRDGRAAAVSFRGWRPAGPTGPSWEGAGRGGVVMEDKTRTAAAACKSRPGFAVQARSAVRAPHYGCFHVRAIISPAAPGLAAGTAETTHFQSLLFSQG